MAKVSGGAIRLIDKDGDPLDDGNGRLNINATLEAASVNVGDIDVLSVPAPLNVTGGGTESSALRVTLANDSTGVLSVDAGGGTLSIDDGGGTITIDGTVTANLSATDNAVLDDILADTDILQGAVHAEDSASGNGDSGVYILGVRRDLQVGASGSDGDYASLTLDYNGNLYTRESSMYALDSFAMIDVDNASEQLSATVGVFTACHEIFLQADESNSGYVMVGDEDVADNRGMKLNAGDTIILNSHDTRGVYLWGSAANQNVRCMIKTRTT